MACLWAPSTPQDLLHVLQDVCREKLGKNHSRLRIYTYDEVQAANAAGNCLLILDGALGCCLSHCVATAATSVQAL